MESDPALSDAHRNQIPLKIKPKGTTFDFEYLTEFEKNPEMTERMKLRLI
jgi:hypothetical protein